MIWEMNEMIGNLVELQVYSAADSLLLFYLFLFFLLLREGRERKETGKRERIAGLFVKGKWKEK